MISLTSNELEILHCKYGSRKEYYRLELLDRGGVKKCDLELVDGSISAEADTPIQKAGTIKFLAPNSTRKVETNPPNTNPLLVSPQGLIYELGIGTDGLLYTLQVNNAARALTVTNIKVDDEGILYTEDITSASIECKLIDLDGFTWRVGIEESGIIYTQLTDDARKIYYRNEKIEINYLTDRVKIYMGIDLNGSRRWYSLGVFLLVKPTIRSGIVSCQIYDENILVQQARIDGIKVFLKGTLYTEVLSYLLISLGFININIEPSVLALQTDIVLDGTKTNLEWFNYFAEQINYTNLYVNADGWFISKKYVEPSPLNVGYIYEENDMSILTGEVDVTMDIWQVANIFTRIVSHPQLGEMTSTYINDDPTDPYSVVNREKIVDRQIVDNIASQVELDNLTRKAAWRAKQISQDVVFGTLNMPHHEIGDILDLRSSSVNGIFVENGWSMQLKAGAVMQHKVKRLVRLDDKY
nr:MAG TPA: protein of unknown function (DUF5048) [Caudoviricetes sp.]DAY98481.1 MAG TPA: protein of unknown function (DUF5048) [Caudoviricetes sp.]